MSPQSSDASVRGRKRGAPGPLLSRRALNRALLARQMLLDRHRMSAFDAVQRLVGLQSQAPSPPYVALWTRLADFDPNELSQLLLGREAVRMALMRGTIYLVTAADALALRPLLEPVFDRGVQPILRQRLPGIDHDQLRAAGRAVLEAQPRTWEDLGRALAEQWPEHDQADLARVIRDLLPLVQVTPRGVWGMSGPAAHTTVEAWLGRPPAAASSLDDMVVRYLAAYGPASVRDVQAWSGLTRLGPVIERLRPRLVTFATEDGVELFDLPDAPRPDPETPAPLRFLAEFDTALLSHRDRTRIMTEERRRVVFTINGIVQGTVLVDGLVGGIWKLARQRASTVLTIESFGTLPDQVRAGLTDEGARLLRFVAAEAPGHAVHIDTLS